MKNLIAIVLSSLTIISCKTMQTNHSNNAQNTTHAIRLKPGDDLRKSIEDYVKENNIAAGWIATCAGSLTKYNIRFANQKEGNRGEGHFEIVGLSGTLSTNGCHIHISISDSTGRTIGGHLLQGNIVYTTAEIVIQSNRSFIFKREKDGTTPWEELKISDVK